MTQLKTGGASLAFALTLLLGGVATQAATVLKMDLAELCDHAELIFRGTVVAVEEGTVFVGGADLPTVTYTLIVEDALKGTYTTEKGVQHAKITMLGTLKPATASGGNLQRYSFLPKLPNLVVGQDYLLMTSTPSSAGLSATIGLGQGCFHITGDSKGEFAVNELGNAGLFNGPVSYSTLVAQIQGAITP